MPRRKITLDEALAVVRHAGLQAVPTAAPQGEAPTPAASAAAQRRKTLDYSQYPPVPLEPAPVTSAPAGEIRVTLYARHTITSAQKGASQIQTYGPGICVVPAALAQHLLHQDMLARQADENLLSRQQKSFVIVEKQNSSGQRASVGVRVSEGTFGNLYNLDSINLV